MSRVENIETEAQALKSFNAFEALSDSDIRNSHS